MPKGKISEEMRCYGCGKKLSKRTPLYDTAWSGVYWCGKAECAETILRSNGDIITSDMDFVRS